jgi:hypothetical protein
MNFLARCNSCVALKNPLNNFPVQQNKRKTLAMHPGQRLRISLASSLLVLLAACGGGGDDAPQAAGNGSPSDSARQAAFATDYGSGLNALNTPAGLTNKAFLDLFDDAFLDAGYTKPQVADALTQEAAAMALSKELSSFASVKLTEVKITDCDAKNVCTLTATLTNSDVDATAVSFTTRLNFSNGKFRLLGDQKTT